MHVLTWILTGLLAGWLARLAQGGREIGRASCRERVCNDV